MKTSTITDIDGNVYKTVIIGNQEWMAENLKVTRYSDGTLIPKLIDSSDWMNTEEGAYCTYENNDELILLHGYLYNWFATINPKNLAPEGFKIPSLMDWIELEKSLGKDIMCGGRMKSTSGLWVKKEAGATDEFGFNALPSGYRAGENGKFYSLGSGTNFWSNSEEYGKYGWNISLLDTSTGMHRNCYERKNGYSIRCFRNT